VRDDRVRQMQELAKTEKSPIIKGYLQFAADEIENLRRWKAEAVEVIRLWDAVADGVPLRLMQRRSDAVAEEIERLRGEVNILTQECDDLHDEIANCRVLEWRDLAGRLALLVEQFGDAANWTHDEGFMYLAESVETLAAYREACRE
jgi:hypothetical protein